MNSGAKQLGNVIHLVAEAAIALGFLIGLLPFAFLWSGGWVLPLVFVSFVLSIVLGNGTILTTGINIAMALLGFIPLLGFLPRLFGIVLSLYHIVLIRRALHRMY